MGKISTNAAMLLGKGLPFKSTVVHTLTVFGFPCVSALFCNQVRLLVLQLNYPCHQAFLPYMQTRAKHYNEEMHF